MSKRIFTTAPTRAISDDRLSGLDLRVLLVIALHDGMSQLKENKPGCYASPATLAKIVGILPSSYARTVTRLVDFGYVTREKQKGDSRRTTTRVIYVPEDTSPNGELSDTDREHDGGPEIVDESDNYRPEIVDEWENYQAEIVNGGYRENPGNLPKTQPQYIPLKGEIDSGEPEIYPVETARFENRGAGEDDFPGSTIINASSLIGRGNQSKRNSAEAGLGNEFSIAADLPRNFRAVPDIGILCRIEQALKNRGWRIDDWKHSERVAVESYAMSIVADHAGTPVAYQANRIIEQIEGAAA